jgi:hypothetical protein
MNGVSQRRRPISALALPPALVPPLVLPLVLLLPLALPLAPALPPRSALALLRADSMPSRPQPLRRMPPPGRAGHALQTEASRTDTGFPRSRSRKEP